MARDPLNRKSASQGFEYLLNNSRSHPLLEASTAGLIRWVAIRQIGPWRAGAQHPKYSIQLRSSLEQYCPASVVAISIAIEHVHLRGHGSAANVAANTFPPDAPA